MFKKKMIDLEMKWRLMNVKKKNEVQILRLFM